MTKVPLFIRERVGTGNVTPSRTSIRIMPLDYLHSFPLKYMQFDSSDLSFQVLTNE
jgi:hypothetical protein